MLFVQNELSSFPSIQNLNIVLSFGLVHSKYMACNTFFSLVVQQLPERGDALYEMHGSDHGRVSGKIFSEQTLKLCSTDLLR